MVKVARYQLQQREDSADEEFTEYVAFGEADQPAEEEKEDENMLAQEEEE